jgi:hypothetical protein
MITATLNATLADTATLNAIEAGAAALAGRWILDGNFSTNLTIVRKLSGELERVLVSIYLPERTEIEREALQAALDGYVFGMGLALSF